MAKSKKDAVESQESKADKWVRLATSRGDKAAKAILSIGPLGNTSQYEFDAETADRLFDSLSKVVDESRAAFINNGKPTSVRKLF